MAEELTKDVGRLAQDEAYGGAADEPADRIPAWHWFVTNRLEHRTVDPLRLQTVVERLGWRKVA